MPVPSFNASVDAQHRRIDADAWERIYVVGDVHGCLSDLERLLDVVDPNDDDLLVFVGDLIRKGPDSHGVVERVRETPNLCTIRGNNEEKVLRGTTEVPGLTKRDIDWIRTRPVAISWDDSLVVHGGVDPRKPLADHDVHDLQNTRSLVEAGGYERPLWFDEHDGPNRVFFGHTPLDAPVVREYAIGLDTGCVYGNALSAYDCQNDRIVQIEPRETVEERAESKFVTPRRALVQR